MGNTCSNEDKRDKGQYITRTILLGKSQVEEILSMGEVLKVVEDAFRLKASGKAIMPPKLYLNLPEYQGDFRAMPAYIDSSAGVKWVSVYPDNQKRNIPSTIAIIILNDPKTGLPLAIMDGTSITKIRTGAAGGIAVKYLARKNSSIIGMIGAGVQARAQLLAISQVLPNIEDVKVFDLFKDASMKYAEEMGPKLNLNIHPVETIQAAADADIVVTTTPSRKPIVKKQYIRPGTHINAIGADAKGKQELEIGLLLGAKIVTDEIEQASHSGEINVAISEGRLKVEDIYGMLGEIISNTKKGRENEEEITVFDSTGLAIQDIKCAKLVYQKAWKREAPAFDFLGIEDCFSS